LGRVVPGGPFDLRRREGQVDDAAGLQVARRGEAVLEPFEARPVVAPDGGGPGQAEGTIEPLSPAAETHGEAPRCNARVPDGAGETRASRRGPGASASRARPSTPASTARPAPPPGAPGHCRSTPPGPGNAAPPPCPRTGRWTRRARAARPRGSARPTPTPAR